MEDVKLGPSGGDSGLPIEGYVIPAGARISEVQVTSGCLSTRSASFTRPRMARATPCPALAGTANRRITFY
jgi:hypothetical protein